MKERVKNTQYNEISLCALYREPNNKFFIETSVFFFFTSAGSKFLKRFFSFYVYVLI